MKNPLTPMRFLERASSVHPDRTAIIDGLRTFTYAAMAAHVTRLAHAFKAKGLEPGDRVAYLAPNCAEMLVAHFAVPLAGGVLVTINTRLSAEEIAAIVEHSGAAFLVADAPLLEPALEKLAAVTTLRQIVTLPRKPVKRSRSPSPPATTICWPPAATSRCPTRWPTRTIRSA